MSSTHHRHQRGFAIILVLWLLVLLSAIGLHMTASGRSELRIARNVDAAARAEALADGGVAQAVFAIADPDPERRWHPDGQPRRVAFGGGRIVMSVRDENAKINPNLAAEPLMAALLRQVGIEGDRAANLAAAITARVRPTALSAAAGAEARPMPLDSIDDLRTIPGMTMDLIAALRPHISIYASSPLPTPGAADAVVSAALAEIQSRANDDNRSRANPTGRPDKMTLSITSEASVPDGAVFVRDAVVRLDSAVPKGYVALRWGRGEVE